MGSYFLKDIIDSNGNFIVFETLSPMYVNISYVQITITISYWQQFQQIGRKSFKGKKRETVCLQTLY